MGKYKDKELIVDYIVEGTVKELFFDEGYFAICEADGFSLRRDYKKYNVVCTKKICVL